MSNSVIDMKNYSNKYQILKKMGAKWSGRKNLGSETKCENTSAQNVHKSLT